MLPQYITRTMIDPQTGLSYTMLEAQYGTKPGKMTHKRWYTCTLCHLDFPASEIMLKNNTQPFCITNGCYKDMDEKRTGGSI